MNDTLANKTPSYFARHWRGELSLPVSYFINTFFLGLLVMAARVAFLYTHYETLTYRSAFLWLVFIIAASTALYTWQYVGVWRSATNYAKKNARWHWAHIAKVLVLIGALETTIIVIGDWIPEAFRLWGYWY